MDISCLVLRGAALQEWEKIVSTSPDATVYHSLAWLHPICEVSATQLEIVAAIHHGAFLGGAAIAVRRRAPFSIARRAFGTPYAHPLVVGDCDPTLRKATYDALLRALRRRYSMTCLTPPPWTVWTEQQRGAELSPKSTFLLDISDLDRTWAGFDSELRNRVRKASKNGITAEVSSDLDAFYELYNRTFHRQGLEAGLSKTEFHSHVSRVISAGVGELIMARTRDGIACAASLFVWDRLRAYQSFAGTNPDLRSLAGMPLVFWLAICRLSNRVPALDLGGANIPSIAQFKKRFGGAAAAYSDTTIWRSAIERWLIRVRDAAIRRSR